jgi:hypothetical protein
MTSLYKLKLKLSKHHSQSSLITEYTEQRELCYECIPRNRHCGVWCYVVRIGGDDMKKPVLMILTIIITFALFSCSTSSGIPSTTALIYGDISLPVAISLDSSDGITKMPFEIAGDEATVQWESSDENIATIDADGNVTVVSAGVVQITGRSGTFEASTKLVTTVNQYTDYVRIRTKAEFLAIFSNPENFNSPDKKYALATDIDFGGSRIDPIGGWDVSNETTPIDPSTQFRAILDGRGYALKNFVISNPISTKVGNEYFGVSLIPFIYDGQVLNLNIIDATFSGTGFTGSIAGKILYGRIENCFVRATITSTSRNLGIPSGGIAGIMGPEATVKNVVLDVLVNGGYIYSGFNFGTGRNCIAISETLADENRRVPIQNTATSTMKDNIDEDAQLKDFTESIRLEKAKQGDISQYPLTEDVKSTHWSIKEGYMVFLIRVDGKTPEWAKLEEVVES